MKKLSYNKLENLFDPFIKRSRYQIDPNVAKSLLAGGNSYSLNAQEGFNEPEYLEVNIKNCVMAYTRNKDVAIQIFRLFVEFLGENGIKAEVNFPEISVSSSFERQMYIAKYLQERGAKISDLPDLLWVSQRTIENDLNKLRGLDDDPIQICGRKFIIEDTDRQNGGLHFSSTAHPIFLTENLTQVTILLKGLKLMAGNPALTEYAEATAISIWQQLSHYAKKRIRYVLTELLPDEDADWFTSLERDERRSFRTERTCSGSNALLECLKNDMPFIVEYQNGEKSRIIRNCRYIRGSTDLFAERIKVQSDEGEIWLDADKVIRVCHADEELFLV